MGKVALLWLALGLGASLVEMFWLPGFSYGVMIGAGVMALTMVWLSGAGYLDNKEENDEESI